MSSQLIADGAWLIVLVLICVVVALPALRMPRSKAGLVAAGDQCCAIDEPISLVALPVVVTDWHGKFVSGLHRDDFLVFEEGKLQDIAAFREENNPLTIGLLVDSSESMRWRHRELMEATMSFLESSNPQDEIFVVSFNERPSLCLPANTPFSSNLRELQKAILRIPAEGETALYDAILLALEQLKLGTRERKSLVIISDGDDNASHVNLQQILTAVESNSLLIYALAIVALGQTGSNPAFLKRLAKITGGKTHILNYPGKFASIGWKLARELHEQYTLVYASSSWKPNGVFRTVRVKVRSPEHKMLFVRTRAGYAIRDRHPQFRETECTK